MADNVDITPGSGATISADEIGGTVKVQRVKPQHGADGSATDTSFAAPLPVSFGVPATRGNYSFAQINAASSGNNSIVAATGGQTIRVFAWCFIAEGTVKVKWRDNTLGADLHPAQQFYAGGGIVIDPIGEPILVTGAGGALDLNLSAAVQVSGWVLYTKS
ncbi:MAG: hypothetical protein Q8O42_09525 [Acidobacteriota bacterium]|nr:hypothetical protein [Acidobacteriota bacterium]